MQTFGVIFLYLHRKRNKMTNRAVILLNEWADFDAAHPDGELGDFCRHYLARQRQKELPGPMTGGAIPQGTDGLLLKLIGRINKLNMNYTSSALEGTGLHQVEELGILLTVQQQKNPRKTEIIHNNLFKLTSGTNLIGRLKERGLINEYNDGDDKRSKRIELTPAGKGAIELARIRMGKVSKMMVNDLSDDDKTLCIALLKNIDIKYSALWLSHKGKAFDEIYDGMME
jgi:DNA-binding MarR family transcriptional regulator